MNWTPSGKESPDFRPDIVDDLLILVSVELLKWRSNDWNGEGK